MRALTIAGYGSIDQLSLKECALPEVRGNNIRIRVVASSVSQGDYKMRTFKGVPPAFRLAGRLMFGLLKPRNPVVGSIFSGVVDAIGPDVTAFSVGDRVGGLHLFGTHADYFVMPATGGVCRLPDSVPFRAAAACIFGGNTALHFLRQAELTAKHSVLVIGAGGAVGSMAVQLARYYGATVTAIAPQRQHQALRDAGTTLVLKPSPDGLPEDVTSYDCIFDTTGRYNYAAVRPHLKAKGSFIPIEFGLGAIARSMLVNAKGTHRMICGVAEDSTERLEELFVLMEQGALQPHIRVEFNASELREAHHYIEAKQYRKSPAIGSVVIDMTQE